MKILLMFYIIQIKAIQFSVDTIVSVTDGVLQKHHATCLYILQTPLQQGDDTSKSIIMEYMTKLTKMTSLQILVTSMSSLVEKSSSHKCNENLPFYLLLNNDVDTKEEIRKNHAQRKRLLPDVSSWHVIFGSSVTYPEWAFRGPTSYVFLAVSIFAKGRWLQFFTKDMELDDFFRDIFVPYDCEFMVVQRIKDGLVLIEVYRHYPQILLKNVVAKYGNNGFLWTERSSLERRKDLQGVTIRVGVTAEAAAALKAHCVNMEDNDFCRSQMATWTALEHATNCISEYKPSEENTNYISANGTWNGVIGLLISGQVDVGVADFGITSERKNVVNYMSVTTRNKLTTYIRKPETGKSGLNYILQPFSSSFWWIVLLSIMILIVSLSKTWYISVRTGYSLEKENYRLYNSWLIVYGIFCQQGHDTTPVSWPCRIVYLTAYLTYVVLFTAYAAIYISMLAVQYDFLPFTDFRGLIDIGTYQLGVTADSVFLNIFDKATDPILQEVYEKMLKPNLNSLPENANEAYHRVCEEGNYAFFFDSRNEKQFSCEVEEVPGANFFIPVSFMISKDSPYHRIFSHQMENLRRTGILNRIAMLQIPIRNDYILPDLEVTIQEMMAIFIILLGGVSVAILCLVAELTYFYISSDFKNLATRYRTSFYY